MSKSEQDTSPLPPPESKAVFVQEMFASIAGRYDLMNRVMTLGRDRAWRRYTVRQVVAALDPAGAPLRKRVLDVATGTGDLALEMLRQRPDARVTGLDFVPGMLALARQKAALALGGERAPRFAPGAAATSASRSSQPLRTDGAGSGSGSLDLAAGDAQSLPFPPATFDAVVTGFALRNVTDIPAAFAEMARVTRPGGRIACLEIAKPRLPLFRRLFALYFYRLVPLVGGWITGQPSAYTYLPHSLTAFLTPDEIVEVMRRTGWREVHYRRLMLGTVAVHSGVRE